LKTSHAGHETRSKSKAFPDQRQRTGKNARKAEIGSAPAQAEALWIGKQFVEKQHADIKNLLFSSA